MAVLLDSVIDPILLSLRLYTQNREQSTGILCEFDQNDVVLLRKKFDLALIFIFSGIKRIFSYARYNLFNNIIG